MADEPTVPDHMSLEGRANLIADVAGALHPDPATRRKMVKAISLAHLRAAIEQSQRIAEVS